MMADILGLLLLLGCVVGTFTVIFRGFGSRVGRPPSGILTRYRDPQGSRFFAAALAAYALAMFLAGIGPTFGASESVVVGFLMAILVSLRSLKGVTIAFCNLLAAFLAFHGAFIFIKGSGSFEGLAALYRLGLMMVVLLSFTLGAFVGKRDSAVAGTRGYALFGLVEISTFLADPTGRDSLALGRMGNVVFMLIVAGVGFALGWAVSEYMLGVVVIAIVVVTPFRASFDNGDQAALVAGATALAALFLATPVTRRTRSG